MKTRISEWVAWLRLSGRSEATVAAYRWELEQMAVYRTDMDQLDFSGLLDYLAHRQSRSGRKEEKLSLSTMKRTVNALRSYYTFIGSSAANTLPVPQPKLRLQRTLNFQQASALLMACDTGMNKGRRDLAMVALMLDTGLRAAEICRLRVEQLDLPSQSLHVVCKGGADESAVYSMETANYLSAWLANRGQTARCPNVFVSFNNMNYGGALTTSGLRCLFHALGQRAGLPNLSPHDLRRSFATLTTLAGAPGRIVQTAGRWHDLALVERYTQATTASDIAPYSPVHRIMMRHA